MSGDLKAADMQGMFRVILLDHHKTAFEMFDAPDSQHPNLDVQLDINKSGATIALDYFKPQVWNKLPNIYTTCLHATIWHKQRCQCMLA